MNGKLITTLCTVAELVCVTGLTAMGLKRNNDCYKAEAKLAETKIKLIKAQMDSAFKEYEIKRLEKELNKLKNQEKLEES